MPLLKPGACLRATLGQRCRDSNSYVGTVDWWAGVIGSGSERVVQQVLQPQTPANHCEQIETSDMEETDV